MNIRGKKIKSLEIKNSEIENINLTIVKVGAALSALIPLSQYILDESIKWQAILLKSIQWTLSNSKLLETLSFRIFGIMMIYIFLGWIIYNAKNK